MLGQRVGWKGTSLWNQLVALTGTMNPRLNKVKRGVLSEGVTAQQNLCALYVLPERTTQFESRAQRLWFQFLHIVDEALPRYLGPILWLRPSFAPNEGSFCNHQIA